MKTDDLIAMLSTNVESVDRRQLMRTLGWAAALGGVVALACGLIVLGARIDVVLGQALAFLALKVLFATATAALAFFYLLRLSRPGDGRRGAGAAALLPLPFAAIVGLAAVSLIQAPTTHWQTMIMDDEWLECLLSIPIIAIVPFALVIWAVRQAAPTNLRRAGALAGLVAGSLSAIGYAVHCTADSLPFIAVWYGGTILLCAFAGVVFGPRLLRW